VKRQPRRKQPDPTAPQARGAVRAQFRIDEQRAVEFEVVAKRGREVRGAVADDHEFGSARPNGSDLVAQLRDLLTTEQSAEVADEGEDDRLFLPVRRQVSNLSRRIGKCDARQPVCDSHDPFLLALPDISRFR
jgi:hypothetical protein